MQRYYSQNVLDVLQTGGDELTTKKGPVFSTATIAGVMAAKKTSDLIPFCHPLPLENCDLEIQLKDRTVLVDFVSVYITKRVWRWKPDVFAYPVCTRAKLSSTISYS